MADPSEDDLLFGPKPDSDDEMEAHFDQGGSIISGRGRMFVDTNADFQWAHPFSSAAAAAYDFGDDAAHAFQRHTFAGQLSRLKVLPDSSNVLDPIDPFFDVFDELTEAELRDPEFMDEASQILRQSELDRLRTKMQWNSYYDTALSNAGGVAQFIGTAVDLDMLAPFGIPLKLAGRVKTAVAGGAVVGGTTGIVEAARVSLDPEASTSELYTPVAASAFLGFALGGLLAKPLKNQNAARVINASNKVVDSGELSAVKAAADDVQRTMDSELDAANNITAEEIRKRYLDFALNDEWHMTRHGRDEAEEIFETGPSSRTDEPTKAELDRLRADDAGAAPLYSSSDIRKALANLARTTEEQASRENLLSNPELMKAKADEVGLSVDEMVDLTRTNLNNAKPVLKSLQETVDSPEFKSSQKSASERTDSLGIKFSEARDEIPFSGGGKDTQTPEFKNWFKESKIVDKGGRPLVVYHGSRSDIESFDPSVAKATGEDGQVGTYFTEDPDYAHTYAMFSGLTQRNRGKPAAGQTIYPVYLSLQNPLIIKNPTFWESVKQRVRDRNKSRTERQLDEIDIKAKTALITKMRRDELEAQGYDGIINERANEIIAFRPTQIKSTFNKGTHDPENPRIDEIPFSGGDEAAAAAPKPKTPPIVKERGRWQPVKNAITTTAAKIGTQFPYFRVLENKLYGIPETNKLADELSEEMHRLAGTPTITEGGGAKPGVDIRQQQYSGLYDQAMRSASDVYREYRGKRPGGEGALRMAAMEGKDFITNTADRLRGNEAGVPFKVSDFYNWMAYASAHNRKFDAAVNETETIRDLFRERGWGEAEWNTVVNGLDRIQDNFLNKIGDELSAERMVGTDGAIRRAEVAEEVAANYDKRAGTLKTEMEKLPDGDGLKGLLKSITDDLEVRADAQRSNAMHEMLAAGDPETAMKHMLKMVSITLKKQLGSTRGRSDLKDIKSIRDDLAAAIERIKILEGMKVLDRADLENAIQIMDRVQKSLPGTSRSVRNKNFEDEPWAYEYKEMKADLDHGLKQVEHAENKNLKDMPRKDENYFPRLNRADRIDQNRGVLKEMVIKRMREDPQVRGRPTSLAAEDIAERAENVIENMRGRAIRVDTEGVMDARRPGSPSNVISRQSPLYDRDLLGRSPEESFIETDIRQVLQAYINRVGPAISMTKEYGDSSMFRQLISMDEKIDNAMLDAVRRGDGATATAIRAEGDAILESFKDMRSGVLKTRGFHEDPSTLSYRTIRVLKNAGITSLMGRAGQLAAADMGRLGLAMQMRDMIALASAKWNNPEEVGMAWAQAQLAGDVSETAISARAAATHDIGGGAYLATKFEKWMEKFATGTFIASGLTPFTDMLKGTVSIFTHSEILRLSQAASEGTIRLMDRELPKQIGEYLLRPNANIVSGRNKARIGAQHSRKNKIIEYDEALIRSQFKDKVWMTPRIKGVDALPANAFKDPEHWFRFNLMHEWMHAKYPKRTGEATAAYENRMNREAMRRLPFLDLPKKNQPTMLERLRRFGIEEEDAIALNAEWQKHGGAGPSIEGSTHQFLNVAETEKWTDARLRNLFRGAVSHEARQIITTPTIATKPMFMDNNLWSYLLQFQNFPITATFTSTARMFQTPKEKAMHRMVAGMLMGGWLVQNLRSGEFDTDFTDQALRAIDYSGVVPLIFSVNNVAEIGLGVGLRPLLSDSESVMRDVSPVERVGPLVGPYGSNILRMLSTLPEGEAADITKGLMRLSPFANLWANQVPELMTKAAERVDEAGN